MDLALRLVIVLALVAVIGALTIVYRRRTSADEALGATDEVTGEGRWPVLPGELLHPDDEIARHHAHGMDEAQHGKPRGPTATWVIFTTPFCTSCNHVEAQVEQAFPHHRVLRVDATERPDLADLYTVRRAPTTLVADANGAIVERFVGPEQVAEFIYATEDPAFAE